MIIVDETEPIGELDPTFPYRDVTLRRDASIRDSYDLLNEIGRGKFGRVYKCRDKKTGLQLAAKVVSVRRKDERLNVEREMDIMRKLHHPRIIQLFDAIEDDDNLEMCLILEMVEGGELFDRVIQDEFVLTEKACSIFVRQICEGIEYIHSKNIVHLDMKPENVMCVSKSGNRIKIIDFGLARFYDSTKKLQVLFGTPEFVAPEVVNFEEISYTTDMWSVGVITYVLLSGLSPFMGETDIETMANVTISKYDFDDECFDDISYDAKEFIQQLLKKNKSSRMTASECLKHRWLTPHPQPKKGDSEGDGESESESVEDLELPELREGDSQDDISSTSVTPDSMLLSVEEPPHPSPAYLSAKRGSLDMSKDNLKEFVNRYSDNPYLFDTPRGIISHVAGEKSKDRLIKANKAENSLSIKSSSSPDSGIECEGNLVSQIRRFSKQLHEELEIMKKQCHS